MGGVLIGFGIIGVIIAAGWVVGRIDLLGPTGHQVLSRLVFFVLTPCLLFSTISRADVHVLFSDLLVVSALASLAAAVVSVLVLRLVLRRTAAETTIGTMGGAYVNANNIGLPVATYVLGSATFVAPVLLYQLLVITPIVLSVMDTVTNRGGSLGRAVLRPFTNPLLIGSVLGVLVAVLDVEIPDPVMQPLLLVGGAAVPVVLLSFGMSLSGSRPLQAREGRADIALATALKLVLMPVVAWLLGAFVFDLDHDQLFVAVVLAGLPSAQNVFNYAQRYRTGVVVARDTVLLTTIGSVPVLVLAAALLK
ncbi:AEC family transporter [Frigoribacterium sp. VKM Ac-2530]|jgi:malonate transporter|uniref:AEC family transporter n=1 Tax=Frigoribacterium sp. VKM Ac-2530 TaxID=2783822 RepID=UPI00188A8C2C|nr:AEC family transporter [Frigoribacterium sp. VKM Ac-2530]MBF4581009.1 AEC family transporter [Frigoribacterium sp. VKM Ac-2530]